MKLESILTVAESLNTFVASLKESEADARAIRALCAINEEFRLNIESLQDIMFKHTDDKKKDSNESSSDGDGDSAKVPMGFAPPVEETPTETISVPTLTEWQSASPIEIIPVKEIVEAEPEGFYHIPGRDDAIINRDGDVMFLINGTWEKGYRYCCNGYVSASPRNCDEGPRVHIARALLKTFIGVPIDKNDTKRYVEYENNNRLDCRLENIRWGRLRTYGRNGYDPETVDDICQAVCDVIKNDPNASKKKIMEELASKNLASQGGLNSIFTGKYAKISDKYFTVKNGRPILVDNKKEIFNKYVEEFSRKRKANKVYLMQNNDLVIPILQFLKAEDGTINSNEKIQHKIHKEYGRMLLRDKLINDVKAKKIRKDLCDLVF